MANVTPLKAAAPTTAKAESPVEKRDRAFKTRWQRWFNSSAGRDYITSALMHDDGTTRRDSLACTVAGQLLSKCFSNSPPQVNVKDKAGAMILVFKDGLDIQT